MSRRPDVDGRELLLAAASRLFARDGIDATSIRAVNREAKLGPASVHYHFSTKEGLLEAVLQSLGQEVVSSIISHGEELASTDQVSAHDVITMISEPYVELLKRHGRRAQEWVQIIDQLQRGDQARGRDEEAQKTTHSVARRAFARATQSELDTALTIAIKIYIGQLAQLPDLFEGRSKRIRAETLEEIDFLVDFLSGGLAAALDPQESPN